MNEVTKINLGRQVFTIASEAREELTNYLDAINSRIKDPEVTEEIESRMAELLTGRSIGPEKVVLKKDIDFLKTQLGQPEDFQDEDQINEEKNDNKPQSNRRLFRDTDKRIIAGVASGLAAYFGLEILLVRILFILLLLITFGWGLLIYVLLWILMPEAKTASDRLQMTGQPVTVDSLRELAKNSDLKKASSRLNTTLSEPINRIFRTLLKIIGLFMSLVGLSIIFGIIAWLSYFLINTDVWSKYNIFPIGTSQHILLYLAMSIIGLAAVFVILIGLAIYLRRWPIRSWITGTLAGILVLGICLCAALGASVYPSVRNNYDANVHTSIRSLNQFASVSYSTANLWNINFGYAPNYYVSFNYFGTPKLANIKTSVNNSILNLNTAQFSDKRNCSVVCIPNSYNLSITIHSPNFSQLETQYNDTFSNFPFPRVNQFMMFHRFN